MAAPSPELVASPIAIGAGDELIECGDIRLLGVDLGDGVPFVSGKKLTSFSKKEEFDYAREDVAYELEDALKAEGAEYSSTANWQPRAAVDGRLITGQNPASAGPVARELLAVPKDTT